MAALIVLTLVLLPWDKAAPMLARSLTTLSGREVQIDALDRGEGRPHGAGQGGEACKGAQAGNCTEAEGVIDRGAIESLRAPCPMPSVTPDFDPIKSGMTGRD